MEKFLKDYVTLKRVHGPYTILKLRFALVYGLSLLADLVLQVLKLSACKLIY